MYTKRNYSLKNMVTWTMYETMGFILLAVIPVVLYDVLGLGWLYLPWLPIALIGTAVAFIISFQNNAAYGRIWEARKIWGGIVNTSRSWSIMVHDFITNKFADEKVSEDELKAIKKELIYRHIAWMSALRKAMREPRPWEHFFKQRSNRKFKEWYKIREHHYSMAEELEPYLSKSELEYVLSKTNQAHHIVGLQSKALKRLREKGLIEDFRHVEMENILVELYNLQGKSERIKNFPYPRQYATLNYYFVWIFLVVLPFGIMHEFDKIGLKIVESVGWIGNYFVWFSIPFSVVVSWIFHTMERIGRVGENPFEGSANDVPITTIARGIEIDLREMLDESPDEIPKPLKPEYHIQM